MSDFIIIHAYNTIGEYLPTIIRISNIRSIETRITNNTYRVIFMNDDSYYDVKETIEELIKMIKENGK